MESLNPFEGQRVVLRAFEADDAPALHALLNHPALAGRRYLPDGFPDEAPLSLKQVQDVIGRLGSGERSLNVAIVSRSDGTLLGHGGADWHWETLTPTVHVVIDPQYWRQGYGTESARLLVQYVFDTLPARAAAGGCASWNQPARDFARRLGFTENGAIRRIGLRGGQPFDWVMLDVLRHEWEGGDNAAGR